MASLVKKIIRGRPYYYARVCKRVDGKPKIVSQTYLGRADKIIEKLRAAPAPAQPLEAVVREFGASATLLSLARRLQLVEHIDRHLPKRGFGPSVGTLELPRFGGHLRIWEKGVHDGKESILVSA